MSKKLNTRLLFTLFSACVISLGTFVAIRYAKGQRPTTNGQVRETGLLSANSFPTGSQVFVNDKLTTATDDTLNLDPGEYMVEIRKDGFSTWRKKLNIQKEVVTLTDARLFPAAPSLSPITLTGVQNVSPAPDGQKLVFYTSSASAEARNGLYLADLTDTPLSLQRGTKQISTDSKKIDLSHAQFIWSPDSSELMVTNGNNYVILDVTKLNTIDTMSDVSLKAKETLSAWEEEMYLRERQILAKFPDQIIQMATQSAANVYFSPDQEKIFYTATTSANLAENLVSPPPSRNSQPEKRNLVAGEMYIYDRKEDKNFLIGQVQTTNFIKKKLLATDLANPTPKKFEVSPEDFRTLQASTSAQTANNFRSYHSGLFSGELQWYPDSKHLIKINPSSVSIIEYDSTNETTVYAGPFDPSFVYPWSNGDKLLILTSFSQPASSPNNLYAVELK